MGTPIVRRSRCGCVHGPDGDALMICSVHVDGVEGQVGVRIRTKQGELKFFAIVNEDNTVDASLMRAATDNAAVMARLGGENELRREELAKSIRVDGRERTLAHLDALADLVRVTMPGASSEAFVDEPPIENLDLLAKEPPGFA